MSVHDCITCPPDPEWPYLHRVMQRIGLVYFVLVLLPNWRYRVFRLLWDCMMIVLLLPIVVGCAMWELVVPPFANGGIDMKTWVSGSLAVLTVVGSWWMLGARPEFNNQLSDFLTNMLVAVFAILLGSSLNEKKITKAATDKWMPAAESACKELIVIASSVERIQEGHGLICGQIDRYLPTAEEGQPPVRLLLESKCKHCGAELSTVKSQVNKAISDWETFLGSNCESKECEQIQNRLKEFKLSNSK